MKVLVKLPVKLGDTIMAAYFLRAIKTQFPSCRLEVIVAKGLEPMLDFMPYVDGFHLFSKSEYSGPAGNYRFGRLIRSRVRFDIVFCLPFSFSAATSCFFTGAKVRIGYAAEYRSWLLTHAVKRPTGLHVVEEFAFLLEYYTKMKVDLKPLGFLPQASDKFQLSSRKRIILNIKSGQASRNIPLEKAISLVQSLLKWPDFEVILVGAPAEANYIAHVKKAFKTHERVIDLAGKTTLKELAWVVSQAECMITTDSGNAHVANAVGTPTVVLFGAGFPHRAQPYDQSISKGLVLDQLGCVPCRSEKCRFGDNHCLTDIENTLILGSATTLINQMEVK
jgi:lipopolysaccharide heptosyltransferase II